MIKHKKNVLAREYKTLKNPISQALGLMFQKPHPLVFEFHSERKIPIHMLFVFGSITAIWLDKHKQVVDIQECKPFAPHISHKDNAKYLVELPLLKSVDIKIGDELSF